MSRDPSDLYSRRPPCERCPHLERCKDLELACAWFRRYQTPQWSGTRVEAVPKYWPPHERDATRAHYRAAFPKWDGAAAPPQPEAESHGVDPELRRVLLMPGRKPRRRRA